MIFKKILTKILHKAKGYHTDADPDFFVVGQSLKGKHPQCLKRALYNPSPVLHSARDVTSQICNHLLPIEMDLRAQGKQG